MAYGTLLGLSISGFALVLYPAWQISLVYIFLPFGLAWCWIQRQHLHFGARQWAGVFTALCVFVYILGCWWLDAQEAIHAIRNTVYPGQRVLEAGGDIDPWFFIKGLLSLQTMYHPTPLMDPSDAGSFIFLPLALAVAGVLSFKANPKTRLLGVVLAIYIFAVVAYMFTGSNATIARWSLWGAVTSYRLDLALGLAQILIMGWIFSNDTVTEPVVVPWLRWAALSVGAATFASGAFLYNLLPATIANELLEPLRWLTLLASGGLAYMVVARHYAYATVFFCIWMLTISLPFNPLMQAPNNITINNALLKGIERAMADEVHGEIAVIDERTWSLILPIAGQHVTNSVFYHPPTEFWKKIDPDGESYSIYNRYQSLYFRLKSLPDPHRHSIHSPRIDAVVLTMDPKHFNFKKLSAKVLLSPAEHKDSLSKNASLEYIEGTDQWSIFRIKN